MQFRTTHAIRPAHLLLAVLFTLPLAAAASGDHDGGHGHGEEHGEADHHADEDHHGGDEDHHHDYAFGQPAKAAEADRTIRIKARDSMAFRPERVDVEAGETVRFVVHNTGNVKHAFTLGTPSGQQAHEREMSGMSPERMAHHMEGDPNGFVVAPGETESLTWQFDQGGPVQFACHMPGHYAAGMKGRIAID